MSSKKTSSECFVYIMLPWQTKSVTAGRFVLTPNRQGTNVGRFVYGKKYLSSPEAVEIDPVELKLANKTFETARLEGVFSALRDASPDFWGRYVIEKHSGKTQLDELDYLLESPDDRAGALSFGLNEKPPAALRKFNKTIELGKLQELAEKLITEQVTQTTDELIQAEELLKFRTSMGGARPKAVVEDKEGLWLAKFGRPDDKWNHSRVERSMLELARLCGINAARSLVETVGGKDVLLVQRFDRLKTEKSYFRARMISGLTLLGAEESVVQRSRWSYVLMSEELRRVVSEPKKDAAELFRRMCFNALISNTDDHPRNHALIAWDHDWKLSPAYDLTPSPMVSLDRRDLALDCGDLGRYANAKNLLSQCTRFLLSQDEAKTIIDDMTKCVKANWYNTVRANGVSESDADKIRSAFVYEGFEF